MIFPLLLILASAAIVPLAIVVLSRRTKKEEEDTPEQDHQFRPDRYRPLNKLLSSEDLVFISEQGLPFHRALLYRFRRFRVTLAYLRALSGDFARVQRSARHLIVCSDVDLPELSAALMRAQVVFWGASALAHAEAVVMLLGLTLGVRNVETALGSLSEISQALAAARQQTGAVLCRA